MYGRPVFVDTTANLQDILDTLMQTSGLLCSRYRCADFLARSKAWQRAVRPAGHQCLS